MLTTPRGKAMRERVQSGSHPPESVSFETETVLVYCRARNDRRQVPSEASWKGSGIRDASGCMPDLMTGRAEADLIDLFPQDSA